MLERHIIQASARAYAEKERSIHQAREQVLQPILMMPPGVYKKLACPLHSASPTVNILLHLLHCSLSSVYPNICRASYRRDVSLPQNTSECMFPIQGHSYITNIQPSSQEINIGATLISNSQIPFTCHQLAHSGPFSSLVQETLFLECKENLT